MAIGLMRRAVKCCATQDDAGDAGRCGESDLTEAEHIAERGSRVAADHGAFVLSDEKPPPGAVG